jgi:hypothetical protein
MPPDFRLVCTTCGSEAVWDTEAVPPVGEPAVGHPVVWYCATCEAQSRHEIAGAVVITEKLHHEICVATEVDRPTVDRVMAEVRRREDRVGSAARLLEDAGDLGAIADAAGVPAAVVREIVLAEGAWCARRGYAGG